MADNKIIDEILAEWAMRSHDGLVGGHDTPENIKILQSILWEYGIERETVNKMTEEMVEERKDPEVYNDDRDYLFKVFKPNTRDVDYFISVGHPNQKKHPDKEKYFGKRDYDDPKMYKVANTTNMSDALVKAETDETLKALRNKKSVSIANVQKLKGVFQNFPDKSLVEKYKKLFDKIPTIEEAILIYRGQKYPEFQPLINAIDDVKFAGGGRGEIPIVFILEGASSGGGAKMDIIFAEKEEKEGGVEVKEVTGGTIAISAPTLHGFSSSKFNVAIHELALAANKTEGMKEFLKKVLKDNGKLYKNMGSIQNAEKLTDAIESFFIDPKVGEVSQFLLDAIFVISEKLQNPASGPKPEMGSVEIDIGAKHREFKIPDEQVSVLNAKIDKVSGEKSVLNVPVEPKKEKDDKTIAEKCMKLSFFKENWDQERVQDEIMRLLTGKAGKYNRMIIIDKRKGVNNAELYKEDKIKTLEFVALGFGKIYMYVPGMGKTKAQAAGGIKTAAPSNDT